MPRHGAGRTYLIHAFSFFQLHRLVWLRLFTSSDLPRPQNPKVLLYITARRCRRNHPTFVRIGYLPTLPSFKHLQQSRTRLKSAPPLLREFLLGRPTPRQILPSAPHLIPRKSPTEHCIYMTLIALHQSESDSSLSLFSFHCSMICSARRSHLSREK